MIEKTQHTRGVMVSIDYMQAEIMEKDGAYQKILVTSVVNFVACALNMGLVTVVLGGEEQERWNVFILRVRLPK